MAVSDLTQKISNRLMRDIAGGEIAKGEHLATQVVADRYGVSRTPVRDALAQLADLGILVQLPNRGYFVAETSPPDVKGVFTTEEPDLSTDYQKLAEDWMTDKIGEEATELSLRQRYGFTKARLQEILGRAAREGWAERKPGYGWRFLPVAKTPEAFDQIYRFRMTIEPAAMLEPTFRVDPIVMQDLRRSEERLLQADLSQIPDEGVIESGPHFHEQIMRMSGNPFFLIALQRVNQMRRLMEYRAKITAERVIEQSTQHLEILALLEDGKLIDASYAMRQHINGALRRKYPFAHQWASS